MGRVPRATRPQCFAVVAQRRAGRSGDQDNPLGPLHSRMRVSDRDLIRGEHYGQRSCEQRTGGQYPYQVNALIHNGAIWAYSGHTLYPHRCGGQDIADDCPGLAHLPELRRSVPLTCARNRRYIRASSCRLASGNRG